MEKTKQGRARYIAMLLALVLVVLLGSVKAYNRPEDPRQAVTEGVLLELDGNWQQETERSAGYAIPSDAGEGLMLSVKGVKQDFALSLRDADGQETVFYTYKAGNGPAEMRFFVALPDGAAGKTVVLEAATPAALGYMMRTQAFLGTQARLTLHYIGWNLYALVFFLLCVLCAGELCILLAVMRKILQPEFHHQARIMAGLVLDAGVWVLTDSELLALATEHVSFIAFASLVSFGLLAPLTLEFVRCTLKQPCRGLRALELTQLGLLAADILGWMAGMQMFWLLIPTHLTIIASIVLALRDLLLDYKSGRSGEVKSVLLGFGVLAVCAVVSLAAFYGLHSGRMYAVFYCEGLLGFLLLLGRTVLQRVKQAMDEQAQLENYKKLAYADSLTGLSNYAAFRYMKSRWPEHTDWVYIVMDVNWLKQTNDKYGHRAGDELLCNAARCIKEAFYRADDCFRTGGDEFAVIGTTLDKAAVDTAVENLRRLCAEWDKKSRYPVSMAVGYAMQAGRAMTADELFTEADAAMYRDKADIKKAAGGTVR